MFGCINIKIKTTLLENAYDFLNNSLYFYHIATHDDYPQENKRYWMFSIVDVVQAMELIFKEVLRRENEIFLYENIDNPKHTVSITKAVYRLKNIKNLELMVQDERIINKAIEIRNKIIHFEVELDVNELHNEADSSKENLLEVAESQLDMYCVIAEIEYKRIKYGEEEQSSKKDYCGDCAINKGYFHVFGCDLEVCPKCNGQAITCECKDEFFKMKGFK